jgi:ferredoxin
MDCVEVCPVDCFHEDFLKINEELSLEWPVITEIGDVPDDADKWKTVKEKRQHLDR